MTIKVLTDITTKTLKNMKLLKFTILAGTLAFFASCGSGNGATTNTDTKSTSATTTSTTTTKIDTPVAHPAKPDTSGNH